MKLITFVWPQHNFKISCYNCLRFYYYNICPKAMLTGDYLWLMKHVTKPQYAIFHIFTFYLIRYIYKLMFSYPTAFLGTPTTGIHYSDTGQDFNIHSRYLCMLFDVKLIWLKTIDIKYIFNRNLQFLNQVMITKTKIYLHQT